MLVSDVSKTYSSLKYTPGSMENLIFVVGELKNTAKKKKNTNSGVGEVPGFQREAQNPDFADRYWETALVEIDKIVVKSGEISL